MFFFCIILACSNSNSQNSNGENTNSEKATTLSEDRLTQGEYDLLQDHLLDIRKGIRPYDENANKSLGICKPGSKHSKYGYISCAEFIGKDGENLPAGDYILYSHFSAPDIQPPNGWKVEFEKECKTIKKTKNGESVTTQSSSKTYTVKNYSGKGSHISPLAQITSPGKYGAQECSWTMTFFNTNGNKKISGFWSVPAK